MTPRAVAGPRARPQWFGGGHRPLVGPEPWAVPSTPQRLGSAGPSAGPGAPFPLPFSAGRAIGVGPPGPGVITADPKADDVPTGADRSGTSSSRTGERRGFPLSRAPRPGAPGKRLRWRRHVVLHVTTGTVSRPETSRFPSAAVPTHLTLILTRTQPSPPHPLPVPPPVRPGCGPGNKQ